MRELVVVGAGVAGLTAAETLREEGFAGKLTVVSAEDGLPYDRPPLSKQVLSGEWEFERTALRTRTEIDRLDADWIGNCRATALEPSGRTLSLTDGRQLRYDGLVIATGVVPRPLPFGTGLAGVRVLRSQADAQALRADLVGGARLVVVGAGLIGSEVAATARKLGVDVALVDAAPVPLLRQLGEQFGRLIGEAHQANGVELHLGSGVRGLASADGRVTGVELADGSTLPADCVLVAIGSLPGTDWLVSSGLPLEAGAVVCDQYCQVAPGIAAAGDVALWDHPGYHRRLRVEHRTNAAEQGRAAARNLLAAADQQPFSPIPYFWTDQYDIKIQAHGLLEGNDVRIAEGSPREGRFVALYHRGSRPVGVLSWNSARRMRDYRPLLGA